MTLRGLEISMLLLQAGVPDHALDEPSDAVYKLPAAEWLTGDMHRYFFRALEAFDIREFQPESEDCDDAVDLFCALARIAHRRMPDSSGTALPMGRFGFMRDALTKHALVWAVVRIADRAQVLFLEPQVLGRVETLTAEQIASATRCSD